MEKSMLWKKSPLCHMVGQPVSVDGVRVGFAREIRYTENLEGTVMTVDVVVTDEAMRNMEEYGVFMDVMRSNDG